MSASEPRSQAECREAREPRTSTGEQRSLAARHGRAELSRRRVAPALGTLPALAVSVALHSVLFTAWVVTASVAPDLHSEQADRSSRDVLHVTLSAEVRPPREPAAKPAQTRALEDAPREEMPDPVVNTEFARAAPRSPRPFDVPWERADEREFARSTSGVAKGQAEGVSEPVSGPEAEPAAVPTPDPDVVPDQPAVPAAAPAEVRDPQPDPRNRPPAYPARARRRGWEGVVLLHVRVGVAGDALAVELKRSSGHAVLDRAAIDAVQAWTFQPALRGGEPFAGETDVSIRFRLDD